MKKISRFLLHPFVFLAITAIVSISLVSPASIHKPRVDAYRWLMFEDAP